MTQPGPPLPPQRSGSTTAASLLGRPLRSGAAAEKAALRDVATAFDALLRDLQFSIVVSCARSPDCPIVYASESFFRTTGYSAGEVLGRNCRFLQGPATSHRSVMEIRDAMREERPCAVCLLNYRKDGSRFWNAFRLEPIRDECGSNVRWFIGIQADVTRLVEAGSGAPLDALTAQGEEVAASVLQRLEAHQHELAEADRTTKFAALACVPSSLVGALGRIQGCYCLGDPNLPDCPIVFASDYFLRLTGYSCSEVVGRNCRFLQGPGTDPATVARVREALASVPPRAVTVTLLNYKRADAQGHQQPFWNSLHISPLRDADGKVQFFVGVQMAIEAEPEGEGGEHASAEAAHAASASGEVPAAPMADPILLLRQKGVVGSLRVATRALAQHGLRRSSEFQHAPSRAE